MLFYEIEITYDFNNVKYDDDNEDNFSLLYIL